MSKIAFQSQEDGTGTFTIAAPVGNTNRTLTIPDSSGTLITTAGAAMSGPLSNFTSTGIVDNATATSLTIDSAGRVLMPSQPAFAAKFSMTKSNVINSPMLFDAVAYNVGSHYNGTTGLFTAPVAGRYQFNVNALRSSGGSTYMNLRVAINGAAQDSLYGTGYSNSFSGEVAFGVSWVVNLAQNDTFAVWYASGATVTFYGTETLVSGFLIG